jgi:chitin disaccharide deacetylase
MRPEHGPRPLVVCADDFGLTPRLSESLVLLAHGRRLSAVSCIANTPHWAGCAWQLRGLGPGVTVGLHFNLTEGRPLSADLARYWPTLPRLPELIALAHLGRLPLAALRHEWRAQRDAFIEHMGHAPAMVDGHQHVHHLPGVRELMLAELPPDTFVRSSGRVAGPGFGFKRWLIERTGGRVLEAALRHGGWRHNAVLLGAYDFAEPHYRGLVRAWLREMPARGALLFCHPGPCEAGDAIGRAREREHRYFASEAFLDDLAEHGAALVPATAP